LEQKQTLEHFEGVIEVQSDKRLKISERMYLEQLEHTILLFIALTLFEKSLQNKRVSTLSSGDIDEHSNVLSYQLNFRKD
jgi:hypothetical protein